MYKSFIKSHHLELNNDLELFANLLQMNTSMEKAIPIAQRICEERQVTLLSIEQADYVIKYHLNRLPFIKHHYFAPVEPRNYPPNNKDKKKRKKRVPNTKAAKAALVATAAMLALASTSNVVTGSKVVVRSDDANTPSLAIQDKNHADHKHEMADMPNIDNIPKDSEDIKNPMDKVQGWWGYEANELIYAVYNCNNPSGLDEIYKMLRDYKESVNILETDSNNLSALDYLFRKLESEGTRRIGYAILDYFLPYLENLKQEALVNAFNHVAGITETEPLLKKKNGELFDKMMISMEKKDKAFLYKRYIRSIRENDVTMFNRLQGQTMILNEEENPNEWSPLRYAIESWDNKLYALWKVNPTHHKKGGNMLQIIQKLLPLKNTVDKNKWTPLLIAADRHKYGALEILLENGVNIKDAKNDDGDTALKIIQNNYPEEMVKAESIQAYNPTLISPKKLMEKLISGGANPNLKNNKGISAYMMCKRQLIRQKYIVWKDLKIFEEQKNGLGALPENEYQKLRLSIYHLKNLIKYYDEHSAATIDDKSFLEISVKEKQEIDVMLWKVHFQRLNRRYRSNNIGSFLFGAAVGNIFS